MVDPGATKSPSSTTGEAGVTDDLENRPRESETPRGGRQAGEEVWDDLDDLLSRLWKYLAFASDNPGRDLKEMEKVVEELQLVLSCVTKNRVCPILTRLRPPRRERCPCRRIHRSPLSLVDRRDSTELTRLVFESCG